MPKRYLLYIHNDSEFDKLTARGTKSGLVNQLLDRHFEVAKKPVGPANPVSAPTPDVAGTIPGKVIKTAAQAKSVVAKENFCQHGFAPGFCKIAKCKNSKRK